ncbi:NACHT domain-containing protein [Lentzea sp. NPDC004789]
MAQDLGSVSDPLKVLIDALKTHLSPGTTTIVAAAVVVLILFKYFGLGKQVVTLYRWLTTRTDKRRAARRARFADHIESQMRRLGEKEEWRDHRYAELEAELEITGRQRVRFLRRTPMNSLKRVPSLSKALEECEDRIVLLEGEPGAGKSVAMRHLTQRMAGRAMRKPSEHSVIPIYVNLKTFKPPGLPTADDVRAFVIESINAVRDRDVERFLEEEFDRGMREGTWLFLFDSFDEIPEILSATSANRAIEAYADAVHTFLHAMNACRGVVASREFRGPGRAAWPTFRAVPLSGKRRTQLVRNAELPPEIEDRLLGELPNAESGVLQMSGNPLFLGLLCEHMRGGHQFPTNVHAVLETYVSHRLARDTELVRSLFGVTGNEVRSVAEEFAFLIADRQSLGLEVRMEQAVSLLAETLGWPAEHLERAVKALIYTKIARTDDRNVNVTFSHRRLQEYFATCVVIREPDRVPVRTLLTSGRWRETAVTILQAQRADQVVPLLTDALALLCEASPETSDHGFQWPPGLLYLLGLLAEGGSPSLLAMVPEIPRRVGVLLRKAWESGRHFDRKWALEVSSVADTDTCRELLGFAFAADSEWLRQEAFAQLRRVPALAGGFGHEIRKTLVDLSIGGRLRRERMSVRAQLRRMPNPAPYERAMRLLIWGPYLYAVIACPAVFVLATTMTAHWWVGFVAFLLALLYYFNFRLATARESASSARFRALVPWLKPSEASMLLLLPITLAAIPLIGWFYTAWNADRRAFVVAALVTAVLLLAPSLILTSAEGVTQKGMRDDLKEIKKLWMELPKRRLLFMAIGLGVVLSADLFDNRVLVGGVIVVYLLIFGLIEAIAFVGTTGRRIGQWRRLRAFRKMLLVEIPSTLVLRNHLFRVRDANVACQFFIAMYQKDIVWPADVLAFLDRVAIALETRDYRSADLPPRAKRRAWVRSPEVLDQLSIFLGAQRRKTEATSRRAAGSAGRG